MKHDKQTDAAAQEYRKTATRLAAYAVASTAMGSPCGAVMTPDGEGRTMRSRELSPQSRNVADLVARIAVHMIEDDACRSLSGVLEMMTDAKSGDQESALAVEAATNLFHAHKPVIDDLTDSIQFSRELTEGDVSAATAEFWSRGRGAD